MTALFERIADIDSSVGLRQLIEEHFLKAGQKNNAFDFSAHINSLKEAVLVAPSFGPGLNDKDRAHFGDLFDRTIAGVLSWEQGLDKPHPYHNSWHMGMVASIITAFMIYHQGAIAPRNNHQISRKEALICLLVACGHDWGHPSKPNPKDQPYHNELVSFHHFQDALGTASEDILDMVYHLLIATSPSGPYQYLKAVNLYKAGGIRAEKPPVLRGPDLEEMAIFSTDRKLRLLASLLNDADLAASAGLGHDLARIMGDLILQEQGKFDLKAAEKHDIQRKFKARVFGQTGFLSMAGRALTSDPSPV